jgi:hypothetical protein
MRTLSFSISSSGSSRETCQKLQTALTMKMIAFHEGKKCGVINEFE